PPPEPGRGRQTVLPRLPVDHLAIRALEGDTPRGGDDVESAAEPRDADRVGHRPLEEQDLVAGVSRRRDELDQVGRGGALPALEPEPFNECAQRARAPPAAACAGSGGGRACRLPPAAR